MVYTYKYTGYKNDGRKVTGKLEAPSQEAAEAELERKDVIIVDITHSTDVELNFQDVLDLIFPPKVKVEDLIIFCRQMNALTRAGVPLMRALNGLSESVNNRLLRETLIGVRVHIDQGSALAAAMEHFPKLFGNIVVSMIRVGENTGKLDVAFVQVATYLELERETKKRIKQATRYPTIVMVSVLAAIIVINVFVIPAFANVFEKFGAELPFMTKILIASSYVMTNFWWVFLGAIAAAFIFTKKYIKTYEGRLKWDHLKLRLPLLGSIFERIVLARFARVFAMLSGAGVPILTSIVSVSQAVDNAFVQERIMSMHHGIERGDSMLRTATQSKLFTPLVLQMIAVGEETGQIDEMLLEVALFYEQEVDYDLKKLADAIEPILLLFMGGMVLVLALGVFLPMWNLSSATG